MDTGHAFLLLETTVTIFMAGVLWTMQLLNREDQHDRRRPEPGPQRR